MITPSDDLDAFDEPSSLSRRLFPSVSDTPPLPALWLAPPPSNQQWRPGRQSHPSFVVGGIRSGWTINRPLSPVATLATTRERPHQVDVTTRTGCAGKPLQLYQSGAGWMCSLNRGLRLLNHHPRPDPNRLRGQARQLHQSGARPTSGCG